jgi:hypothetical protein
MSLVWFDSRIQEQTNKECQMRTSYNGNDGMDGRALMDSSVTVDNILRKVEINYLVVESPELFELLRKCESEFEQISETRKVIDIGAFVKSKVQMAVDTDYFDRRVAEMTGEFETGLEAVKVNLLKTIEQKFDHENCCEKHLERNEQNCRPGGADAG